MADPPPRSCDFNWPLLKWDSPDLSSLDRPFSEDEIWQAIRQMPHDKAPGPDGFTGLFFRKCWQTIQHDIIAAINSIYYLRCHDLNLINKANIILLPKKEGAEAITDYRPISLIHAVTKIVTKVLALRLQPFMHRLISACQSAFIKKRAFTTTTSTSATSREDFIGPKPRRFSSSSTFQRPSTQCVGITSSPCWHTEVSQ
jgi:hypothetical protein